MKIETYRYPKSSFLSLEKDMSLIVDYFFKNENLKKLLYYPTKDCLSRDSITEDETVNMFNKQIKIVPKLQVDKELMDYVIISFDNFFTNPTNPQFRDNIIEFDIICHFDTWQLKDFQLRPYRIAAEIDSMFNNKHLSGIGLLEFSGASQLILNDEFAGLCLLYRAVHGEEDKQNPINELDETLLIENFKGWNEE